MPFPSDYTIPYRKRRSGITILTYVLRRIVHRLCPSFFQAKSNFLIRFPPLDRGKRHTLLPFLREELGTGHEIQETLMDHGQSAIRHPLTAGCIELRFQHIQRSLAS